MSSEHYRIIFDEDHPNIFHYHARHPEIPKPIIGCLPLGDIILRGLEALSSIGLPDTEQTEETIQEQEKPVYPDLQHRHLAPVHSDHS